MNVVAITIVYATFAIFEILSLKKTNRNKELIAFSITISFAFIISMLITFDVKLPSINRFIGDLVYSITKEQ